MRITIIGCGNMGRALASRLSSSYDIQLYDRNQAKVLKLQKEGYGKAYQNLSDAVKDAEIVFLAVKPQGLAEISKDLSPLLTSHQTLISLLAGIPLEILKKQFSTVYILRMMPNLAIAFGEGLVAYSSENGCDMLLQEKITKMSKAFGKVYWLKEELMDAFTALAGSGPGFLFALIESMIEAGVGMGFDPHDSQAIVYQMIKGSIHLLETTKQDPAELKRQVSSPGGTTLAGLQKFEENAVKAGILSTFYAARDRAIQLSETHKK